jgi:hypothetical protein
MPGKHDNVSPNGGQWGPPPGPYPSAQPNEPTSPYSAPGQQYASPPPPKKRSIGRRILALLMALVTVIGVRIVLHAVLDHHSDPAPDTGLDYAIGTCLDVSKANIFVKPSDVHVEPCSSPTALAKVATKYKGAKNCPNDQYGTLDSHGSGLCLQDNLTVGNCYRRSLLSHMFTLANCTPGLSNDPTFKVALRRDGVNDPALCTDTQRAVNFPEPPLTYCLDALVLRL